jgi:hypothetical protein
MNTYKKRYDRLVEHYRTHIPNEIFCEKHHIVPLCLGGIDSIENIILIPARAHFICHYLLHKAYPNHSGLAHAFAMMAVNNPNQNRQFSSRMYEASKMARSRALKGKSRPEWVKVKLRKPKRNKQNYFGNTNGRGNKGNKLGPQSVQHKTNLALALRPYWDERKRLMTEKVNRIRQMFVDEGISRKEFAIKHNIAYSSLKKYLKGI